ncbi:Hint domain-containing protein, partial [Sinomonas atrocyanea]
PAYTAPPPPPAPGNTHTVSAQRTTTPAPDPYLAQHKYEIAATALALVAGAALCAATAGLGCLIGAAVLGGALTTTGYAADTNWTAPPDDLATHFLEDTAWGLAGGAAGKAVGTIAGRLGGAARGTSALGRDAAESCLNSFTSDTPVLMEDGTRKPIAEVRVGDRVIATDPEKGTTAAEDVQALIRHSGPHDMVDITLVDGSTLHSTDGHPIWNATTKTFTDASDLKIGEQIQTTGGALLPIAGLKRYKAELTAYNLQIDKIHTYYAGETPILVHNSCSLYQKLGPDGEHLKYGISNNPSTRYTAAQLNGGSLKILATGERRDMLALERDLHSTLPIGPEEGQSIYVQIQIKKGLLPPPY